MAEVGSSRISFTMPEDLNSSTTMRGSAIRKRRSRYCGAPRSGDNPLVSTFRSWRWDGGSGKFPNIFHHAGGFEQFDCPAQRAIRTMAKLKLQSPAKRG